VTKLDLTYVHEYGDRHGHIRRYFRNVYRVPLPGKPGSPEFMAAYEKALANAPRLKKKHLADAEPVTSV
jgi:hypothetical protein